MVKEVTMKRRVPMPESACLWLRSSLAGMAMVLLCPFPVLAQQGGSLEFQAHKACLSGQTDKGIAILAELYATKRKANYIYNQARCYQQNDRPAEAISRFREYLRVAGKISAKEGDEVEKQIAECQAMLSEKEAALARRPATPPEPLVSAPVPAPTPVLIPASPPPEPTPTEPGLVLAAQPAPATATESSPFYKTWWFWSATGAVVVAGVVTAFLLTRPAPDPCGAYDMTCKRVP